jgi:TonB-linked SusC/RagA family outer membrane protein
MNELKSAQAAQPACCQSIMQHRRPFPFFSTILLLLIQFFSIATYAQDETVSGTVTDDKGAPVPAASVTLKGTQRGTTTDVAGKFAIQVPGRRGTLVFSGVGLPQTEVAINGRATVDVQMQGEAQGLGEVVVVGYGTQKKATLTGAVSAVRGSEVLKSPAMNVSNSLAGRLPGLVTVTPSSEPGYDGTILRIRGLNTLNNNGPLIVVDGIPGRSLERLDPSTIENISVLKDASAAIYGAQAANGVILITTKRGKAGKPIITMSYNHGYGRPTRIPQMADAPTYATMLNEINAYAGKAPVYSQAQIETFRNGTDPWNYPNTDWFNEVLRPWSMQNYGNVSISGGSEGMRYFVSLSGRSQDGFYYNSGTKYNQYDFRTNLDGNISKYVTLGFDVAGRMEDRNFPTRSAGSIFRMVMRGKPNMTAYWPNGLPGPDIEYGDNPVVVSTKATGYDHDKRYVLNTNGRLKIDIPFVPGLSVTGNAAIDKSFRLRKVWTTPWYLYSFQGFDANNEPILERGQRGYPSPELNESMEDNQTVLLNGLINYEKRFASAHFLNFLVGVEKITGKGDNFGAFRKNFISSDVDQLFAGSELELNNTGSGYNNARLNYFGRVNYNYKEKYLAEFVWRYQGSYIFPEQSRFGFFPGISLGYVISEEPFFAENIRFMNSLKLRGSWGKTGNDLIDEFQYIASYEFGGFRMQPGNSPLPFITNGTVENKALYESLIPNPSITWEVADQKNFGFDATLMQNKLTVTADYFVYNRSEILWRRNASVPASTGLVLPRENIGEVSNKGFDFGINYSDRVGELSYQFGLNGGKQKNKIEFWDEPPGAPEYQQSTGRPIGSSLYYEAIGIFHTAADLAKYPHLASARTGDVIFRDVNGDGAIDANDRVRYDKSDIPTFTAGITMGLQYKGFDMSILIQGASGAVAYINTESGEIGNFLKSFSDNRWTEQNPNASGPRTFNRGNEYWVGQANTYWLRETDYIRLKNIELGYTIPIGVTQRLKVQKVRVYVNAFNFLTYTPDMKEYDPELAADSGQGYPLQKIVNGGISVTF